LIYAKIIRRDNPTKNYGWMRRRVKSTLHSIHFGSLLVCVGRAEYPMSSVKVAVGISSDASVMEFHLTFDDDWKHADIVRLLDILKKSKNVESAFLTSDPQPAILPA
jgi:hypothetical protein